ncbi:hypothetical protein VNO78_21439 [Psophocarpus tetragonolobus]|uniref:Pentatricopeptide repeat-containing protein n=1 Tax=Psophocarpus tetragonolobus TaxID=3891 RepID=A0AAN9SB67_PSOTE
MYDAKYVTKMASVLSACAMNLDLEFGRRICSYIENNEFTEGLISNNAMLDMYVKCENINDAKDLLNNGKPREALPLFHEMQLNKDAKPNEVTLICALCAYAQLGQSILLNKDT